MIKKIKTVTISILALSILVVGLAVFAGNGYGAGSAVPGANQTDGTQLFLNQQDSDSDGIINCEDGNWVAPMDETGYGAANGQGQRLADGSGLSSSHGHGQRLADGSGMGRGNGTGVCTGE